MVATWKSRLIRLEPLALKVAFRRALWKARRVPAAQFWDALWTWAPGDGAHKWLDLAQLTEEEVALIAGPGFDAYGATLDDDALCALVMGGPALLRERGVETYAAWVQRHPWLPGLAAGPDASAC